MRKSVHELDDDLAQYIMVQQLGEILEILKRMSDILVSIDAKMDRQ